MFTLTFDGAPIVLADLPPLRNAFGVPGDTRYYGARPWSPDALMLLRASELTIVPES